MEKDILWVLECAEADLSDDVQALAFILDTCETNNGKEFLYSKAEITNAIQTLLKSMIYNKEKMQKAINEYYENSKKCQ